MRRLAWVLATVVFVLGACGGDDDGGDEVSAASTSTTSSTGSTSSTAAPSASTTTTAAAGASTTATSTPSTTVRPAGASTTTTAAPATTTTAAPAPTTTTTAAPATTTTAAPAPTHVPVTVRDFAFEPASLSAPAGPIHFAATNEDGAAHTFTVEGTSVDIALPPNGSGTDTETLTAGSYDFRCRIHGSMTGTLTVT